MELLKDLGTRTTVTSSGKKNTRRWGLYRCPVCEEGIERSSIKGSKNNTCGKAGCRSKGSTEYGSWNKGMKSSEKTINKPYYSTIGDYYRKLDKTLSGQ